MLVADPVLVVLLSWLVMFILQVDVASAGTVTVLDSVKSAH